MNGWGAVRGVGIALAMLTVSALARADAPPNSLPRDVVEATESLHVPPLPADYVTVRRGSLEIAYPRALTDDVRRVVDHADADAHAVERRLGGWDVPRLQLRLVPDPDTMRRLAPMEAPPPPYAVGVAYPGVALALVSASAPASLEHSDMRKVLRHEMAHLLLESAIRHASIPRWFSEGFAIDAAGEHDFERFKALAVASFTGGLVPLRRLDEEFSRSSDQVTVAYAESADFIAYLLRTEGESRFSVLLGHLGEGMALDGAVRQTYRTSLNEFEFEWRHDLEVRFLTAPLWAGTGFLWLVGMVLLIVAFVRLRTKSRATLARWEREEHATVSPALNVTVVVPGLRGETLAESPERAEPAPPRPPEPTGPEGAEIVVDGERHTLH